MNAHILQDGVRPATAVYATTEIDGEARLVGVSVPDFGVSDPVQLMPADDVVVHHIAHANTPATVPVLCSPDADPRSLASWRLPAGFGTIDWSDELVDEALPESPEQTRSSWHRLAVRAAFLHRRFDDGNVRADLLAEGLRLADQYNWRSISTKRLRALAAGDTSALPSKAARR